jgi:hypothetical protein
VNKTHDYIHHYRGYWSDGGRCRIRIYREDGWAAVIVCSQLPDNRDTSVTNMAGYLAAEVIEVHGLPTPLTWIEHYPEHEGESGEYSLVRFSSWDLREVCLGGVWRFKVGSPKWSSLNFCPHASDGAGGRRSRNPATWAAPSGRPLHYSPECVEGLFSELRP